VTTKRPRRYFTNRGKTHTLSEWSRIKGIPYSTLKNRLDKGWTVEQALVRPHKNKPAPGRPVIPDLTDKVFGRITVIGPAPMRGNVRRVRASCECGAEFDVDALRLMRGQKRCRRSAECRRLTGEAMWDKRYSGIKAAKNAGVYQEFLVWGRLRTRLRKGEDVDPKWCEDFWEWLDDVGVKPGPSWWFSRLDKKGRWDMDNACWMQPEEAVKTRKKARKRRRKN